MSEPVTTPEERKAADHQRRNAEGHAAGMLACPVCGDSINTGKAFHETTYHVGTGSGTLADADGSNQRPASHEGGLAVMVMCEECWSGMGAAERLPHYEARLEKLKAMIPGVLRRPAEGGGLEEDPADLERYERDLATHKALTETLTAAVKSGG